MSKKYNKQKTAGHKTLPQPAAPAISRIGKKTILAGAGALVAGFIILALADPSGQNTAARLAPFIIIGAYAAIGVGIVLPDPDKTASRFDAPDSGSSDGKSPESDKHAVQ
ncbi:MAG: hypothetical protein CVU77_05075 [Elusimicrobia bacterium HGW-Elusimicrobia-1]|jgi:hypothetical protein|nr:MAG: hypothetical protein CVU77_05075 [Elusimicrobia bacterium HGW-Elusimicrobia-1]